MLAGHANGLERCIAFFEVEIALVHHLPERKVRMRPLIRRFRSDQRHAGLADVVDGRETVRPRDRRVDAAEPDGAGPDREKPCFILEKNDGARLRRAPNGKKGCVAHNPCGSCRVHHRFIEQAEPELEDKDPQCAFVDPCPRNQPQPFCLEQGGQIFRSADLVHAGIYRLGKALRRCE